MAKKNSKPTRKQIVAKQLYDQSVQNSKLRKKEVNPDFFKLFIDKKEEE